MVKAFVSLKSGLEPSEALRLDIMAHARKRLGAAVAPKEIAFLAVYLPMLSLAAIGTWVGWRVNREAMLLLLSLPRSSLFKKVVEVAAEVASPCQRCSYRSSDESQLRIRYRRPVPAVNVLKLPVSVS